jgi:hypothetical protein
MVQQCFLCAVGVWRHNQDCNGESNYVSSIVKIRVKAKHSIRIQYMNLPFAVRARRVRLRATVIVNRL